MTRACPSIWDSCDHGRGGTAPALARPEGYETDHHGFPSYRVGTKIFATLPNDEHLHVMVDEDQIRALAAAEPTIYAEKWSGGANGLRASASTWTAPIRPTEVGELLADAWARKAPPPLSREHDHAG